jgi:type I restriction-modification system DNA methylase subunit
VVEDRREKLSEVLNSLVRKFEANKGSYKASSFLEANLRLEFVDVLFEGLGWDVHNKKGLPPSRKDVIVERGESGDRPDYNFRIDGVPVLYVETKQPAEDLDKTVHIMQAKAYAWSGKRVKVVGLTDFEEFRLFDATLKPNVRFPDQGEIFRLHYSAYLDNLDTLLLLHYDAIAKGSLDGLLLKDKKSVAQRKHVDEEFLNDLNGWRLMLAKGLYKNSGYTYHDYEISDLVQHLLDRVLFVRIAEERDVIEPRQLADKLDYWKRSKKKFSLYKDILVPLCREINRDVDGDLLKAGHVDDAPFDDADVAELIEELYPPKSIYRLDEMPIELIGAAYEQYLGNVIRCTPKQVKRERKPEVRKAGVVYTPEYIVDYIVENTVGKLVEGKAPREVEELRILDPACGSGSFLIGALEYLIDYVTTYYREHPAEAGRDQTFPYLVEDYERGEERLSVERKVRLLENCIYGVDIDPHAVEVTKLSLYLKVLEGERRLPRKHAYLKSLEKNIKCGNSLIGSDYWDFVREKQGELFERKEEEERRVNPFDWYVEFGNVMKGGGFDVVIGNPPYVSAINLVKLFKNQREYLTQSAVYKTLYQKWDLYVAFIERGLGLLREDGYLSMIIPYPYINQLYARLSREEIINNKRLITFVDLSKVKVFKTAVVKNCILVVKDEKPIGETRIVELVSEGVFVMRGKRDQRMIMTKGGIWIVDAIRRVDTFGEGYVKLGDVCFISIGMVLNADEFKSKGTFKKEDLISDRRNRIHKKPYIEAKDIDRYEVNRVRWLEWDSERVPGLIRRPTFPELYEVKKILVNKIGGIKATLDIDGLTCDQTIRVLVLWKDLNGVENKSINNSVRRYCSSPRHVLEKNSEGYDLRFILGILNSRLTMRFLNMIRGVGNIDINPEYLKSIPIPVIEINNPADVARHEKMVALVEEMLELHKRLAAAKSDADRTPLVRAIKYTDGKINELVYELYGLTKGDKEVIEGTLGGEEISTDKSRFFDLLNKASTPLDEEEA